jgi:hypothetical protein
MLSFVFPCHFLHEDVLRHLASFLNMEDETVAPLVLSVLTFLGKYKPIGKCNSEGSYIVFGTTFNDNVCILDLILFRVWRLSNKLILNMFLNKKFVKNTIFWDMMLYGSCKNLCFRGTYCLYHQWDRNNVSSNCQLLDIANVVPNSLISSPS